MTIARKTSTETYAQIYNAMVAKLMPHHADKLEVDSNITSESEIDEIVFRKSEYLGGMANAICAMINAGIRP
jgi:hypothetical protein